MAVYVLIPGFWLGGWAWQEVTERLRKAGHTVYPVTLTGLADRAHQGNSQVNLSTHIADAVNLLEGENLHDVLLVGHSFAANVITGAAEQVPERIKRLIYVDTWPLPDGIAQIDLFPPEARLALEQLVKEQGEGWFYPLPPWEELDQNRDLDGLGAAERDRMRKYATGQPFGTLLEPVRLKGSARKALPKTVIWCSLTPAEVQKMVEEYPIIGKELMEPGWDVRELPTGHWPMFSKPAELTALLEILA